MLDHEDLKWIATTSTELNSMLQQIARYSDLARQHKGDGSYLEMLGERVEQAAKTAQGLFDRVTSKILSRGGTRPEGVTAPPRTPSFTVMPPPVATTPQQPPAMPAKAKPAAALPKSVANEKGGSAAAPGIPPEIKVLNPKGNRELILLVDDEVVVAENAAEMLTVEGYKVIVAHDGFAALKIYQQIGKQIALVILDFFLPVIDGDAVFDELRSFNPNVNVVLSSGFAEQSKVGNMLSQGLRGFIPKPYTSERLLEQVRSALDASRHQIR